MKRFQNGQRVRITDEWHPLCGRTGVVVRLRRADVAAWVDIEGDPIPAADRCWFPADDPEGRGNHEMLHPDECSPA